MGQNFDCRETPFLWTRRRDDSLPDIPTSAEVFDGRYRVGHLIGRGGMAYVVSATHVQLGLLVAIKLLRPEGREYPEVVARFLREGRASARILSDHVARVFDVGDGPYGPFLVMEHLQGRDLESVLLEEGPLRVERAVDYVLQAGEAIAEAHRVGVIHRDVKPANIFLARRADGSSSVKVLDFGISKLTSDGPDGPSARATDPSLFMGSPPYVSPEQATSPRDVDARTDIWALGATLYELLVGEPPFGLGPGPAILIRAKTLQSPRLSSVRPDVPPALDAAIARCLAVDLSERFASVSEFAHAIAECGTESARESAARIRRISAGSGGWEYRAPLLSAPRVAPVCAMDLVEPGRKRRVAGVRSRRGGYATAFALVALVLAYFAPRPNPAFLQRAQVVFDAAHVGSQQATAFVERTAARFSGASSAPLASPPWVEAPTLSPALMAPAGHVVAPEDRDASVGAGMDAGRHDAGPTS
jgi:serine/threonine-protein kinase